MIVKNIFHLCVFGIYLIASNIFVHAWVMLFSHGGINAPILQEKEAPCHEVVSVNSTEELPTDCFEHCVWIYDDVWGALTFWFKHVLFLSQFTAILSGKLSPPTDQLLLCITDPDPPPIVWYAIIGKEIKKRE